MPEVYRNSPVMTGHKIKAMVVLPTIQAVYDFTQGMGMAPLREIC